MFYVSKVLKELRPVEIETARGGSESRGSEETIL
jgi:hypothetical protein